ncbi:MAG: DNA alkylation repair protein [Chloroflexi bacterium]|nr:DNA alkylation repair protein [Chloroflexota bacterium]
MEHHEVLKRLESLANPQAVAGMARFGINPKGTLGISIPALRKLAKELGKSHRLAQELWDSGGHEARILACMVDEPKQVTERQMEAWVKDLDSWDVCDQCCSELFSKTTLAYEKAIEWSSRGEEFVKRAGFALMACLAVKDKKASDAQFAIFLPLIAREAPDGRNFVKKAVNWALRQIGKRNLALNKQAMEAARAIQRKDSASARWIASDALRELSSDAVQKRLRAKAQRA